MGRGRRALGAGRDALGAGLGAGAWGTGVLGWAVFTTVPTGCQWDWLGEFRLKIDRSSGAEKVHKF